MLNAIITITEHTASQRIEHNAALTTGRIYFYGTDENDVIVLEGSDAAVESHCSLQRGLLKCVSPLKVERPIFRFPSARLPSVMM